MKLWIRSQDKIDLYEAQNIEYRYLCIFGEGSNVILVNGCCFGTYKSKERCLEIINEIHKLLEPFAKIEIPYTGKELYLQDLSTYVYNMPKE